MLDHKAQSDLRQPFIRKPCSEYSQAASNEAEEVLCYKLEHDIGTKG